MYVFIIIVSFVILVFSFLFSQAFPSGERVTYTGKEVLCGKCIQIPIRDSPSSQSSPTSAIGTGKLY